MKIVLLYAKYALFLTQNHEKKDTINTVPVNCF